MSRARLVVSVGLLLGCSSGGAPADRADASTAASPSAASLLGELRGFAAIAHQLPRDGRLEARGGGFELAQGGFRPATKSVVRLPARADRAVRLQASADEWIEVTDADARAVEGTVEGATLAFRDVHQDTDLAWAVRPGAVEDVRILRSERAPRELRFTVRLGPGLSALRAREGRIEALDRAGHARFSTAPAFAVDARGVRRELPLSLDAGQTVVARLDTTGLTHPIAVDPTWQITFHGPPSVIGAAGSAMVALDDRRVLFAGLGGVAVYDAAVDDWTVGTGLSRYYRPLVYVPSVNRVLAGGGSDGSVWTSSAETFDATTAAPTTGSPMLAARGYHTAELITGAPERVLFLGGVDASGVAQATTEWWSSSTGSFIARASMGTARMRHASSRLASGKILVTGGIGNISNGLSTGEVYDPTANTWTATTTPMSVRRYGHRQVTLVSGKVLVIGGIDSDGTYLSSTELYDPTTDSFGAGPSMTDTRVYHTATLLPTGQVLVVAGLGVAAGDPSATYLSTSELYDPLTNAFTSGPRASAGRYEHAAAPLSGGRVLLGPGVGSATAEVFWPEPIACKSTTTCANCVDGACCDRACTGQCEACNLPGRVGVCSPVDGEAPHGARPGCGIYKVCQLDASTMTAACSTSCASDEACATGYFCRTTCQPQKAVGAACSSANECTSSFCVDGVCCDKACTGQCEACAETGAVGTCKAVSGAPRSARTACPSPYACSAGACATGCTKDLECASGFFCDTPSSTCLAAKALGATCTAGTQCVKGFCTDGVCCDSACPFSCGACNLAGSLGVCSVVTGTPVGARTCASGGVCVAGACSTSCTKDDECLAGNYCAGGACLPKKSAGNGCGAAAECASGFCASGVCCNSSCLGECQACNLAGSVGACSPRPSTTACGRAGCVGAATVAIGTCSGTDATCTPGAVAACPNGLTCADAFACRTTCTTGADCLSGACDAASGKCTTSFDASVPDLGPGDTGDTDTGATDTGATDTGATDTGATDAGTTEDVASDGGAVPTPDLGVAESPAPPVEPKPVVGSFEKCTKSAECATGHCVEGVCCDTACTDKCSSCALLGSVGKCTLEPIGVDLKSECGPALSCLGTCDGKGACIGAGKGTMCARNRCTGASAGIGPSYCAAPGATCTTDEATTFDCAPFTCEPAFGACRSNCVSSNDCANGYACDLTTKSCVVASTPPEPDDGGCGCRVGGSGGSGDGARLAGLSLAALLLLSRRRGARRE